MARRKCGQSALLSVVAFTSRYHTTSHVQRAGRELNETRCQP